MVSVRAFIAAGLGTVAVIIIFLGLFTKGWMNAEWGGKMGTVEEGNTVTEYFVLPGELNMGLREAEIKVGVLSSTTVDTSEFEGEGKDWDNAGLTVYIILWAALLVCLGAIICAIIGGLDKMSKTPAMALGYIGGGLMILATILYVVIAPKRVEGVDEVTYGWSLYLVLIGGVIQTIGGELVRLSKRTSRRVKMDDQDLRTDTLITRNDSDESTNEIGTQHDESPNDETNDLSILKRRLVGGEITKEEYEDLKRVIEE